MYSDYENVVFCAFPCPMFRYIMFQGVQICDRCLWCQSLRDHDFCAKIILNQEKIPNSFSLEKTLLLMGWKDSQEESNLDLKLKEFFFSTHPQIGAWLTNQSISPGFWPLSFECCMISCSEQPCGAILHQILYSLWLYLCPYIVKVYIF